MGTHKIEIRRRNVEKILLAAEKVFAEKGYAGTSMGNIAEEAELPRSNLHYYFSTKDELYRDVSSACSRSGSRTPSASRCSMTQGWY